MFTKVDAFKNDFKSGARQMATKALEALKDMLGPAFEEGERDRRKVFELVVKAAKELAAARPAMRYTKRRPWQAWAN